VDRTTFAFLTIQSMTSTKMDTSTRDTYTALSMRSVSTAETLLREVSMTTKHPALSALSSHVEQCWWCPHGMTVHLDGPRSIMGTWWPTVTLASIQVTSSVLTGTQSMFLVAMLTKMAPCCTQWKEDMALYRAFHMWMAESWHAQCAPSDWPLRASTVSKEKFSSDLIKVK